MNLETEYDNFKRTWSVKAEQPVSFTIKYSHDIFNPKNHSLLGCGNQDRKIILIDKGLFSFGYQDKLHDYFKKFGVPVVTKTIKADEKNKNWDQVDEVLKFFEDNKVLRREPVIVIGGGVVLDLAGFACSIYRRGIPYIKIPTTLLAIVDASVGVKVAANHLDRRNRIGSYYPPLTTLIDNTFIVTQTKREISNGLGEIFKLALIKDRGLFDLLEMNSDLLFTERFQYGAVPNMIINRAITGMIEELAPNLWETDLKRCVDFGHTFSPIIEMENIPDLLHGEAVVLDCLFSSCLAVVRGESLDLTRIFQVAKNLGLPTFHKDFTNKELLMKALADTTKHRNGDQNIPIPISIGNYKFLNDVSETDIEKAITLFSTRTKWVVYD